jgi:hypothetical protein
LLRAYLDGDFSQRLMSRQPEIDAELRRLHEGQLVSALDDLPRLSSFRDTLLLRMIRTKMDLQVSPRVLPVIYSDELLGRFQKVLLTAKSITESWGGKFYFVYLPSIREVVYHHDDALHLRSRVLAMMRRDDVAVIDVNPAFEAANDVVALFQCRACHYTAVGHRLASETIAAALSGE